MGMVTGFAAKNATPNFTVALMNVLIVVEEEIEHNG
jgi:hypothetical protein